MKYTYVELAKMIDHSLLHPTMTDSDLEEGCRLAAEYGVASVCIKPYAVKRAVELLRGTGVYVGCVIGFPHGNSCTESKRYETELACRDGAVEIDMVINIGKALSGDWAYVETDIKAVCDEAHSHGTKVKVIFENDYLTEGGAGLDSEAFKRKLCELSERAGVNWVKTSSGMTWATPTSSAPISRPMIRSWPCCAIPAPRRCCGDGVRHLHPDHRRSGANPAHQPGAGAVVHDGSGPWFRPSARQRPLR